VLISCSFWRVVDRTDEEEGQSISAKNPPAKFHMVLDGQQRVQSLLLALGGDAWGFKLLDRQWHEHLNGTKSRGPQGKPHWSLGCLCLDVPALTQQYGKTRRVTDIDYNGVLRWVVTDDANAQSRLDKPASYIEPLPIASKKPGQYVRLAPVSVSVVAVGLFGLAISLPCSGSASSQPIANAATPPQRQETFR